MPDEHGKFNEGDLVRVIGPNLNEERQRNLIQDIGFADDMEAMIGKEFRVDDCFDYGGWQCYKLDGAGGWTWAHEWLEFVRSEEDGPYASEDFDSIFN